jgi:hypothetical protein
VLVATFVVVVGIVTIAVLTHREGYRVGGVMSVPLLAIYTFREPLSPLIFAVGTAAAWGSLWIVREYTLNHGRRVFVVAVLAGACSTLLAAYIISFHTPAHLPFDDAEVVASIFPGVAAYNLMRLDAADRAVDVGLMVAVYVGLMLLGVAGLFYFEGRPTPTPPVLALPTSDLVTWLGVEPQGEAITRVTPHWLAVALLALDVGIYEGIRKRYDLRLAGIIVVPLLAVFSVRLEYTTVLFAVGAMVVFVLLSFIHWLSLLYGRVLLGISLVVGSLYALAIGIWIEGAVPGLTLFFLGLFVGVAVYNLHRVSPKRRAASLRLSAGLFAAFYAVLILFVEVPPSGLFYHGELLYALLGTTTIGLALIELSRLERSRPSRDAFAESSVFAEADVDNADIATSPLVSTGNRSGTRAETSNDTQEAE